MQSRIISRVGKGGRTQNDAWAGSCLSCPNGQRQVKFEQTMHQARLTHSARVEKARRRITLPNGWKGHGLNTQKQRFAFVSLCKGLRKANRVRSELFGEESVEEKGFRSCRNILRPSCFFLTRDQSVIIFTRFHKNSSNACDCVLLLGVCS